MPVPFTPSGKTITISSCPSSRIALKGLAGTPPTLRMKALRKGSSKAQLRTIGRGQRGSGCSFIIAPTSIAASNGNSEPEWFPTTSARPCEGTFSSPVACTRHQTS